MPEVGCLANQAPGMPGHDVEASIPNVGMQHPLACDKGLESTSCIGLHECGMVAIEGSGFDCVIELATYVATINSTLWG